MDTGTLAQRERHALADLLLELGPDVPTLDEGWLTYDLAAHLWVRENDPVAGLGIAVPALNAVTEARIERAKRRFGFRALVAYVRSGPPALMRPVDGPVNTLEYLIHHEDARRGVDLATPGRELSAADDAEIMRRLPTMLLPLQVRPRGVRTVFVDERSGRRISAGRGATTVTVTGRPTELALYATGRERAAHVGVRRDPTA